MNYPLISSRSTFDAVILADGDFPVSQIPLGILEKTKLLICCDGAGQHLLELQNRIPDAIVGDGDSLPDEFKKRYAHLFHPLSEQSDNDMTKATKYALSLKGMPIVHNQYPDLYTMGNFAVPSFAYLGASGKREDHTFSNIVLMISYYHSLHIQPTMVTDYGWFVTAYGKCTFETKPGQQISIFNFSCKRLSGKGFVWPVYTFKELWQGSLNEAVGNQVEIDGNGNYLVYRTFEVRKGGHQE
jgi:thiamine pyrophosphokinase